MEQDNTLDATEETAVAAPESLTTPTTLVTEELLVEEISIDGMCGVY